MNCAPLTKRDPTSTENNQEGAEVTSGFERVLELLWPIVEYSPEMKDIFPNNRPLAKGDRFHFWSIRKTLETYSASNEEFWTKNLKKKLLGITTNKSLLTDADLQNQKIIINKLQGLAQQGKAFIPLRPSVGGALSSVWKSNRIKHKSGGLIKLLQAMKFSQSQTVKQSPWYNDSRIRTSINH